MMLYLSNVKNHMILSYKNYMFALHKPDEERFSECSEAAVLLSVLLSGVPVGIV